MAGLSRCLQYQGKVCVSCTVVVGLPALLACRKQGSHSRLRQCRQICQSPLSNGRPHSLPRWHHVMEALVSLGLHGLLGVTPCLCVRGEAVELYLIARGPWDIELLHKVVCEQRPLYSILCHLLPLFPRNLADLSFNVQHRTWKRCACRFPPHEVGMPCSTRHQARSRQCIMLETTLSPGQRVQEGSRFVVECSDVVAEQHDPCLAHGPDVPLCPGLPVLSWVFE